MTTRFRALVALAALLGVGAAHLSRADAAEGKWYQCWHEVGVDPPNSCPYCEDACSNGPCCIIDSEAQAE
jgi:hypothetical protein